MVIHFYCAHSSHENRSLFSILLDNCFDDDTWLVLSATMATPPSAIITQMSRTLDTKMAKLCFFIAMTHPLVKLKLNCNVWRRTRERTRQIINRLWENSVFHFYCIMLHITCISLTVRLLWLLKWAIIDDRINLRYIILVISWQTQLMGGTSRVLLQRDESLFRI